MSGLSESKTGNHIIRPCLQSGLRDSKFLVKREIRRTEHRLDLVWL